MTSVRAPQKLWKRPTTLGRGGVEEVTWGSHGETREKPATTIEVLHDSDGKQPGAARRNWEWSLTPILTT